MALTQEPGGGGRFTPQDLKLAGDYTLPLGVFSGQKNTVTPRTFAPSGKTDLTKTYDFGGSQTSEDQTLLDLLYSGAGSGGGGYSSVDHFFDVNPLDQSIFDQNVKQQAWQNDFDLAQFNWQKANDDRDYALAVGDLNLAKQKQADANYWQGKSFELEQQRMAMDERISAADNATRTNIAQMEAASRAETARIAAEADRYAANLRLQEGLANATNDQERNRVLLAHEQELASIAKMEDDTKRMIASGEQKIGGFNAETARMAQMGDIALKNNQFLLDASSTPRDLFGLYFMQRGVTPDWDSLAAGNPTYGDPLRVYDPMKTYSPNITMPQDFEMSPGQAYGGVGNASNISLNANPFLQMGMSQAQQQPTQQIPMQQPQQPQPNVTFSGWQPNGGIPAFAGGTDRATRTIVNAVRNYSTNRPSTVSADFGVPASGQGGFTPKSRSLSSPWAQQPQNQGFSSLSVPNYAYMPDKILPNMQRNQNPAYVSAYAAKKNPEPGYTTAPKFLTGDDIGPNPFGNGAKPELIENPTQAPIRVKNTIQTAADFGIMPNPKPAMAPSSRKQAAQPAMVPSPMQQTAQPAMAPSSWKQAPPNTGFDINRYLNEYLQFMNQGQPAIYNPQRYTPAAYNPQQYNPMDFQYGKIARYPIGTDLSQQYANMGMSQLWQNSSNNEYLQGIDNIPKWLQVLADYGTPVAPSLANSVTGRTSPTLNLSSAFTQRGGGVLPSLRTLSNQSAGENQLFQGYLEGPVGMPAQDTLDFIGRPTQNLRTAQRSSAIMN